MQKRYSLLAFVVALDLFSLSMMSQTTTKIVDHGPDGQKLVFVVLGDGYALADQAKFQSDVKNLLINGVFANDFYKDNFDAFNVYRIDLVSQQSGVSTLTFKKNTALKVIYSGDWNRCWLEESPETDSLITTAIKVAKYDFVMILANEQGYGGCRRSSRLYVTSGDPWNVVAHEYGHGIAGLYDEYSVQGTGDYSGAPLNNNNCSVVKDKQSVVWSRLIDPNIQIPSDQAQNIDPNDTVGEFTGCNYAETGIYRPVRDCRMNSNTPHFCPVCLGLMQQAVAGYLTPPPGQAGPPPQNGEATPLVSKYVNLVVRLAADGKAVIQKANEIEGALAFAPQASPTFFGALTEKKQPTIASLIVDDPYVVRGFVDPEHKNLGEKLTRAEEATVILHLPQASLTTALHNNGLRFYSLKPGYTPSVKPSQLLKSKELFNQVDPNQMIKVGEIPQKKLGKSISAAVEASQN